MSDRHETCSRHEALSRLLAGELRPPEARALHAEIAADPELAAVWQSLQALPAALAALPGQRPPPALDAAVLDRLTTPPVRSRRPLLGGLLVLAAAAVALLMLRVPQTPPVLITGMQLVEGQQVLQAADALVSIDGRALVSVEPLTALPRGGGQEVGEMNATHLLTAAAGALVTVAVYEGTATIEAADAVPITVAAGQSKSVGGEGAARAMSAAPGAEAGAAIERGEVSPEVAEYIAALQRENAALKLERNLQEGALTAIEGTPQPWPDDIAPIFKDDFAAGIEAVIAGDDSLELLGVDCEEHPCLAMVRAYTDDDGWHKTLGEKLEAAWAENGVDEVGMGMWIHRTDDDEGNQLNLVGIAISDPAQSDDDTQTRTAWRMGSWLEEVSEGAMEDADVE